MATIIDTLKSYNDRLEELGEDILFTDEERARLQAVFDRGTLSKNICWALWVEYKDKDGKTGYTGNFSTKELECMKQICEERIAKTEEQAERFYNDFSLQNVADYFNQYFKELEKNTYCSNEWVRIRKNAKDMIADVENGKCGFEDNYPAYDCVIMRHRGFYSHMFKVEKTYNGYRLDTRSPLCGSCRFECGKDKIFKYMKQEAIAACC